MGGGESPLSPGPRVQGNLPRCLVALPLALEQKGSLTLAHTKQLTLTKELQHLHRGGVSSFLEALGARLTWGADLTLGPTHSDVLKFHHGGHPGGLGTYF